MQSNEVKMLIKEALSAGRAAKGAREVSERFKNTLDYAKKLKEEAARRGIDEKIVEELIKKELGQEVGKNVSPINKALAVTATPLMYLSALGTAHVAGNMWGERRYKKSLENLYAKNKDLKEYPKSEVEMLYSGLYRLNPELARNPMVAGEWIRNAINAGIKAPPIDLAARLMGDKKERAVQTMFRGLVSSVGPETMKAWKGSLEDADMIGGKRGTE